MRYQALRAPKLDRTATSCTRRSGPPPGLVLAERHDAPAQPATSTHRRQHPDHQPFFAACTAGHSAGRRPRDHEIAGGDEAANHCRIGAWQPVLRPPEVALRGEVAFVHHGCDGIGDGGVGGQSGPADLDGDI
ncbi:uncharacterized protein PgNI_07922 [Pyricularia grisea]|uniref:Uncharacterized protein n=1 Tax=Pyricularia grisea TaxID=148305 RepID=A0A6P8B2E6_PYRGI|nr:uncharacterized protein PgNI_07922 [Pyricularia grisea]TLD09037.1 hypothetical protein PgNI_07922 [Pyricularia grisea]